MSDLTSELPHLRALQEWFRREPNLRPPARPPTHHLRELCGRLEVRFHLGALSEHERHLIGELGLPIGTGDLLSVRDEHTLLRNLHGLKAALGPQPDAAAHGVPAGAEDLWAWVLAMRERRRANPRGLEARIVNRLMPDFPWTDGGRRARRYRLASLAEAWEREQPRGCPARLVGQATASRCH